MTGVILLILLGILLFLIEFLIIPGITIAGIGGLILTGAGIYLAYENFGPRTGLYVLIGTLFASLIILGFSLRAKTWKKAMLNTNIDGKVSENPAEGTINPGDKGITVTRLAPMGRVKVNGIILEGKSVAGYLTPKTDIEVIKLVGSQVIVKPVK
ncbi:MAG TPA: NfeD family protein [Bacteroidales bacterium]|nr:NfeD family protein [Bacteroidales bacterium]